MKHLIVACRVFGGLAVLSLVLAPGCIVGQAPGKGRAVHLRESSTGAAYWLYFPEGYDAARPAGAAKVGRPLVMTFHGMSPFDSYGAQICEWQQEADRYGFVVCAPRLSVSALMSPLPLSDPNNPNLKRDERNIIAIMDELYRTTDVDPNRVLSTSWSYGGYVAHFMANRYPERFSCIAVKQSNFNADLLNPANVPRYRDHKVAIYYTENDFAICKKESRRAADWYARQGFDLTYGVFEKKGHERTPSVAAEFFARTCGLEAKTAPRELAQMQITLQQVEGGRPATVNRVIPPLPAAKPIEPSTRSIPAMVRVRVSASVGFAPLRVVYSALLAASIGHSADVLWTDNGEPMSNGVHGQRVFSEAGTHRLEVLVTAKDGREYRAFRTVTVLTPRDRP